MCCTLGPAELSDTIVYAHRMQNGDHVLGYQNKASSRIRGSQSHPGGALNAMILPIPSKLALGPENAVDLTSDKRVLKDYAEAVRDREIGAHITLGATRRRSSSVQVQVFKTGSYEVVMALDPTFIPRVVSAIHPEVVVNAELMEWYGQTYEDWNVAVCFWRGEIEPEPILFHYEPMFPKHLFAPTLDSHTGGVPSSVAKLDHTIVFGTSSSNGRQVRRRDTADSIKPYFPDLAMGFEVKQELPNGDYWFPVTALDAPWDWAQGATMRLPAGMAPA